MLVDDKLGESGIGTVQIVSHALNNSPGSVNQLVECPKGFRMQIVGGEIYKTGVDGLVQIGFGTTDMKTFIPPGFATSAVGLGIGARLATAAAPWTAKNKNEDVVAQGSDAGILLNGFISYKLVR